ncbi:MAG: slt [Candidatus Magasanikbacteria bacterium]|nr:slt [Candidatus Magasanikbacteria bacterium]
MEKISRREFLTQAVVGAAAALTSKRGLAHLPEGAFDREDWRGFLNELRHNPENFIAERGLSGTFRPEDRAALEPLIKEQEKYFDKMTSNQREKHFEYATDALARIMEKECAMQRVPFGVGLGTAIVESRCKADARSESGAVGVMQLMPETWEEYGSSKKDLRKIPEKNIAAGLAYLEHLHKELKRWDLAVLGFFVGEGAAKYFSKNGRRGFAEIVKSAGKELGHSRIYVPKVEAAFRAWVRWQARAV